ncbi:substrate-binding periplasmic protein [Vibrio coralliilyticus]|uniref:substrate-binding periplasmic protein n=1 Tax=Vibrio coralliilyticus TaxID=190893 RepID=UPI002FCF54C1
MIRFYLALISLMMLDHVNAECSTLGISGYDSWYPYSIFADDKYTGLIPEVIYKVSVELDFDVKVIPARPWKRQLKDLEFGKLDALVGVYYTQERAEKFLYSYPIVQDSVHIFILASNRFRFHTWEDLRDKIGAMPLEAGVSSSHEFDEYASKNLNIISANDTQQMINMLVAGRIDYMVSTYADGLHLAQQKGLTGRVVPLNPPINVNNVYLAFSKKSPCSQIINRFNETYLDLVEQGKLGDIYSEFNSKLPTHLFN